MIKRIAILTVLMIFVPIAEAFGSWQDKRAQGFHSETALYSNYFKPSLGVSSLSSHQDASGSLEFKESSLLPIQLGFGVALGAVSFEGEFGFNNHQFEFNSLDMSETLKGDLNSTNVMFNAVYNFNPRSAGFYIGGGFGFLSLSMDNFEEDLMGASLATQIMAGVEIKMNAQAGLFLELRHLKSVGMELENDFVELDFDFQQNALNLGIKYHF